MWCLKTIFAVLFIYLQLVSAVTSDSMENADSEREDYSYDEDYRENSIFENDGTKVNESLYLPFFANPKTAIYARAGESTLIDCSVQNLQQRNAIVWYKENIVIANGRFVMRRNIDVMQNHSIFIKNVTVNDSGEYYCEVLPEKIRKEAILHVGESLAIFCDGQVVTNRSLVFRQGDTHYCECKSYLLDDHHDIKWFIDGQRAQYIVPRVSNGQMHIENISEQHSGIYQCLADDGSQQPPHRMMIVDVLFAPKVSTYRRDINAEPGGDALLYCDYSANPMANVFWLKNNHILSDNFKYLVEYKTQKKRNRTILNVINVRKNDLGQYICRIENEVGINELMVYIIYEPECPQLESMQIDGRKIVLQWLVKSVQTLTEAVLDYKLQGAYIWSTVSVIQSHGNLNVKGVWKIVHTMELTPGRWHVRIKAKNAAGWSQFSDEHDFRISEAEEFDGSVSEKVIIAASFGSKFVKKSNNAIGRSCPIAIILLLFLAQRQVLI